LGRGVRRTDRVARAGRRHSIHDAGGYPGPTDPRFVEKAARAGCYRVFLGVESLNAKNLAAASKRQNDVEDYAAMVGAWHDVEILVYAGYIIGFPYDTAESVRRDIEALCSNVKVDKAAFFMLTPLPGSRDHQRMVEAGTPLDADPNNYDSVHETFGHPNFAPGEWASSYSEAWKTFYSVENMVNVLLRAPGRHYWSVFWTFAYFRYCALTGAHPMLTGLFPLKGWRRRPGYPRERVSRLAWRRMKDLAAGLRIYGRLFFEFQEVWLLTRKPSDPRWATLAELREKWSEVHQRLGECDVRNRLDVAQEEMGAMLNAASTRLHGLGALPKTLSRRARRKLRAKAAEVDAYLRNFEVQMPSWRQVMNAERYVSESLLVGYEELAIRYVAKRRRFNVYWADVLRRFKAGRVLTLDLIMIARTLAFEFLLGLRFCATALLHGGAKTAGPTT